MATILKHDIFIQKYPFINEFLEILDKKGQKEANIFLLTKIPPSGEANYIQKLRGVPNTTDAEWFLIECRNQEYIYVRGEAATMGIERFHSYVISLEGKNAYTGYLKKQQSSDIPKYDIKVENSPNATITMGNNNEVQINITERQATELLNLIKSNKDSFPEGLLQDIKTLDQTGTGNVKKIEILKDWIFGGVQTLGAGATLLSPLVGGMIG